MSKDNSPSVIKPKWKSGCKNCGDPDDMNRWLVVLGALCLFAMPLIVLAASWAAERGVDVMDTTCAWDADADRFVATVQARNSEDMFKAVSFRVQGRFHPLPGHRWAHPALRQQYEAISQTTVLLFDPRQGAAGDVLFPLPDGEHYSCRAQAKVSRQARFPERPEESVLKTIVQQL